LVADSSTCIVEHSINHEKVLDARASNNAALVLRRTGWITTESCIVVKVIIFKLHLMVAQTCAVQNIAPSHLKMHVCAHGEGHFSHRVNGKMIESGPEQRVHQNSVLLYLSTKITKLGVQISKTIIFVPIVCYNCSIVSGCYITSPFRKVCPHT